MRKFRQVHTKIWKDGWFMDLSSTNKLFFIYLFTNECASISGLYELPLRVMSFESGLSEKEIETAFKVFNQAGKARYQDGVVWIASLRKYHETSSPKVQSKILVDVEVVKSCELKGIYCDLYGIDTISEDENNVSIPLYSSSIVSSSSNSSSKKGKEIVKGKGKQGFPELDEMLRVWGDEFPDKPTPRRTKSLKAKARTRLKDKYFVENWQKALIRAGASDYLNYEGWFTFPWFMVNDGNWEKCLDGNYDNTRQIQATEPAAFAAGRAINQEVEYEYPSGN